MDSIIEILAFPLGYLMKICYNLLGNYGLAIILFTLICKIILLPLGVWLHKNGIKMVKMQPKINMIKVNYFGDKDRIADEQAKLFKEEKYNPLASVFPLIIQIIILMGLIQVIYNPFVYLFDLPDEMSDGFVSTACTIGNLDSESSSVQLSALNIIQNPGYTDKFLKIAHPGYDTAKVIGEINSLDMNFLGFNLSWIPMQTKGISLLLPILAGFSAWLLCIAQNKSNVLQSEQGKLNKYGTMVISVGISLYLGLFVPAGVVLYWILSNLIAIIQMYSLNAIISPKKYIDYEALEESRKQLSALENLGEKKKLFSKNPNAKREKEDYKRFFSVVNKHIVFYSEKSGFYKYFQNVIEELLRLSNIKIHYITSDPDDKIFELAEKEPRIKPYYIGEKRLITLFMRMEADIVVMTMPDLDCFHIKKSYIKKDIEYIFMFHGIASANMVVRKGGLDHYDTIFCAGPHQADEIREMEEMYSLPEKKLIEYGYPLIEKEAQVYEQTIKNNKNDKRIVTIAPSWQKDNILDICLNKMIPDILSDEYKVVIRPHPEYFKRYPQKIDAIKEKYSGYFGDRLELQLDFSTSILNTDLLITDWSTVGYEFSFITAQPTLFIDTPMKVLNPDYDKYKSKPKDITWRNEVGKSIKLEDLHLIKEYISKMFNEKDAYYDRLVEMRSKALFNYGNSSIVGAKYILEALKNKKRGD